MLTVSAPKAVRNNVGTARTRWHLEVVPDHSVYGGHGFLGNGQVVVGRLLK